MNPSKTQQEPSNWNSKLTLKTKTFHADILCLTEFIHHSIPGGWKPYASSMSFSWKNLLSFFSFEKRQSNHALLAIFWMFEIALRIYNKILGCSSPHTGLYFLQITIIHFMQNLFTITVCLGIGDRQKSQTGLSSSSLIFLY